MADWGDKRRDVCFARASLKVGSFLIDAVTSEQTDDETFTTDP